MLVIPAIDIKGGNVVRLERGDFSKVKVYSKDPASMARQWASQGARILHVVDLDAAISGRLKNLAEIKDIIKSTSVPVQVGGGIRNRESIEKILSQGARRVILGTRACEDEGFMQAIISEYKDRVVVSVDAKDGYVTSDGWTKTSKLKAADLTKKLEDIGLEVLIYTDILRDGTLKGPNMDALKEILAVKKKLAVIASGGVSCLEDLLALKNLEPEGLAGVIVGKAIYEKKLNLKEAIERC
jgi:phosphoribosylformimino-5-aminoimidazole carboxamide ribotide isomerase